MLYRTELDQSVIFSFKGDVQMKREDKNRQTRGRIPEGALYLTCIAEC